ncbi:hypothetical protein [Flavobacterium sp. DSP2-3-1]|uniref:hypothetical protein n=1 Tax=Flavobacterium sp. DSP2-3-1 TaxID=2804620 RepID=UPI003CE6C7CE
MYSEIERKFTRLRVELRKEGLDICEDVFRRFLPSNIVKKPEICVFCNSTSKNTKEHVLPKWLFEKDTDVSFISSVNRQIQTFNKAVIPTCANCNNSILAYIEKYTIQVIEKLVSAEKHYVEDLCHIIRWLEILDYKLQVYDCRRIYLKHDKSEYDKEFGIVPISLMRHFIEFTPYKAYDFLRSTQIMMTVKKKMDRINSLVIFDITQPNFDFFTQPNEYIFVSLPNAKIGFFYFFKENYTNTKDAYEDAIKIMKQVFET